MRFRAEQHLRRANDIRAVRELGSRMECRAFTLWWRRRPESPGSIQAEREQAQGRTGTARVCVIASTSAIGNAVRRNRAKRRLREMFRRQQNQAPRDCDLLLIARRAVMDAPAEELERRFAEACGRIAAAPSGGSSS